MQLTLCLPGLLLPGEALRDTARDLPLPALSRLLGHGRIRHGEPVAADAWAARRWGLDALPAAALRVLAGGGDPGGDCWLCLDPVHLEVHRRGMRLTDPVQLKLSAAEDQALRADLAPVFAGLGELTAHGPGRWQLRLAADCRLETQSPAQAIGRDVDPTLPAGPDGPRWRGLLAEAQMILHAHPVNRLRDANGQSLVNSLWLWGPGRLPDVLASPPFDTVWSDDPVLQGLARAAGIAAHAAPAGFMPAPGRVLAVLTDLTDPANRLDAHAWRTALSRLESEWFAPALAALGRGGGTLTLAAFGPEARMEAEITRTGLWKFWRRPLPLAELMP